MLFFVKIDLKGTIFYLSFWGKMEELLTTKEVARLLRLNEKKVYQLIQGGEIPHIKIGGKWLFPKKDLLKWVKERTEREKDLFFGGSDDPLLSKFFAAYSKLKGFETIVFYSAIGSEAGIISLSRGKIQGACCHLYDPETGEYNLPFLNRTLPPGSFRVVTLWYRKQGFLVRKGNPLGIKSIRDLTKAKVKFVNRNPHSGTRILFDTLIKKEGITPEEIQGYHQEVNSHIEVGIKVFSGEADVGLGLEYIAHLFALDFIPLMEERFDLVISEEIWETKKVKDFLAFLSSKSFLPPLGYSFRESGKIIL